MKLRTSFKPLYHCGSRLPALKQPSASEACGGGTPPKTEHKVKGRGGLGGQGGPVHRPTDRWGSARPGGRPPPAGRGRRPRALTHGDAVRDCHLQGGQGRVGLL